jgi:hypothetical protein
LPQVVHSPLNYAMPGVMAHQVPTQARGQVQHITQPSQLPPLMPTPVGQQPMQQSSLSQPNQISSSRPGAYSSQSPQRQQPNLQQSQAHPRTPAQAATSQPQSLPQGPSQPSHTPHGTSSIPSVLTHTVFHPVLVASWAMLGHYKSFFLLCLSSFLEAVQYLNSTLHKSSADSASTQSFSVLQSMLHHFRN